MADEKKSNPSASFNELVTQWERNFDAFANQMMGTEAYSQAMNEMQKAQLGYQRAFSEMMAQQLAALNIPSREDFVQLMDMLRQMDRRLEKIEEKVLLNDKPAQKRKRPARTKQPEATQEKPSKPENEKGESS